MTKIVINSGIGGFGVSDQAIFLYAKLRGINVARYKCVDYTQDDSLYVLVPEDAIVLENNNILCRTIFSILPVGEKFPTITTKDFVFDNWFEVMTSDRQVEGVNFRSDPCFVETVKILGKGANGEHCKLKIVEIPDDVQWHIYELEDGREIIRENSRSWE